jgi:signal recognition particle subunit SEC65
MYFQERGKKVQCMRSTYSKEKGRSFPGQIASQSYLDSTISAEVEKLLTAEEIEQFQDYLDKRAEEDEGRRLKRRLTHLAFTLNRAAAALTDGLRLEDEGIDENPEKVLEALDEFKTALRKAGYKRTRKVSKSVEQKDDRQADLIAENASESV